MTKNEVKRIGVVSLMKISAAIGFVIGFIYGGIIFLMFLFSGAMMASALDVEGASSGGIMMILIGLIVAIVAVIGFTAIYAICGAIWAIIYNLIAKVVGGIELELGEKK